MLNEWCISEYCNPAYAVDLLHYMYNVCTVVCTCTCTVHVPRHCMLVVIPTVYMYEYQQEYMYVRSILLETTTYELYGKKKVYMGYTEWPLIIHECL